MVDVGSDGGAVLSLRLTRASMLPVAAQAVAGSAGRLGLAGTALGQVDALVGEALGAVVSDSFDGAEEIDVDLEVQHLPGELQVVIRQRGAPSTYVTGDLPMRLEALVRLGYADAMSFVSDGVRGSEIQIRRALLGGMLTDSEEFRDETSSDEVAQADVDADDIDIRLITPDDVVGIARLYFRTYGYTKIGSPWIYQPDVFVRMLAEGLHRGVVAVTSSGRVVGHSGLLRDSPTSNTASGGPIAVEPAFRRHGLAGRMNIAFAGELMSLGLAGMYAEAVTAHPASQLSALKVGFHEVGVILGRQPPELEFIGFEGEPRVRRATMVMYLPLAERVERPAHVPARYAEIVGRIFAVNGLPRQIASEQARPPADLPERTALDTSLSSETRFVKVTVLQYGADFLEALQGVLLRLEHERFDVVTVRLPLGSPLTPYFGSGLGELGLSFNAVLPEQDGGDELVLARCFTEQDADSISVASDFGRELLDFVLADRERVAGTLQSRARSRAYVARIIDSI